jgi:hypothetical protein
MTSVARCRIDIHLAIISHFLDAISCMGGVAGPAAMPGQWPWCRDFCIFVGLMKSTKIQNRCSIQNHPNRSEIQRAVPKYYESVRNDTNRTKIEESIQNRDNHGGRRPAADYYAPYDHLSIE